VVLCCFACACATDECEDKVCERSQAQMALLSVLLCGLWMKLLAYSICELHTNRRQRPLHRNSDHHHPVCLFTLLATPPNKVFAQDAYASAVTYLCSGLRTSDVCVHARACSLVCLFIRLLLWYCGLWPSFTRQDTCMQVESEAQKDGGRQTLGTLHATQQQPSGTGSLSTSSGEGKEQEEADKDESVGRRHGGAKDDSGGGGSTAHRAEQLEQSLPDTTPASASEHSATEGRHAPANHQAKDASLANAATLLQRRQLAQSATEQWAKGVLGGWLAADAACTFVANRGPGEAVVVPRDETRLPCSQTDAVGQGHHETGDGCHIFSNGESHQVHLAGAKHAADEQGSHEGSPSLLPATNQALKHSGEAYVKPNAGKEPRNEGGVFAEGQREVVVGFKCMGSDTVLSVTLKYDAIVSEASPSLCECSVRV
jgi:hypothetical protein